MKQMIPANWCNCSNLVVKLQIFYCMHIILILLQRCMTLKINYPISLGRVEKELYWRAQLLPTIKFILYLYCRGHWRCLSRFCHRYSFAALTHHSRSLGEHEWMDHWKKRFLTQNMLFVKLSCVQVDCRR